MIDFSFPIKFIMSNQVLSSQQLRSHSANPTNYKNIEVHAYLDDAKAYRKYPSTHPAKLTYISAKASFKTMSYSQLRGFTKRNMNCDLLLVRVPLTEGVRYHPQQKAIWLAMDFWICKAKSTPRVDLYRGSLKRPSGYPRSKMYGMRYLGFWFGDLGERGPQETDRGIEAEDCVGEEQESKDINQKLQIDECSWIFQLSERKTIIAESKEQHPDQRGLWRG